MRSERYTNQHVKVPPQASTKHTVEYAREEGEKSEFVPWVERKKDV
ncbi:MAG: hypothetical protein IKQ12_11150 [Prevotella sp.]|jgi:hypothetical protein|nr:hypothetical protein [Prevotella sp.]